MRYCWFNTEEEFSFSWGSAQFFSGSSCSPNFIILSVTQLVLQLQAFPKGSRLGLTPGKFPLKSVLYYFCIVGEFTPRDRQTNFCFLDSDHSHMTNCLWNEKKTFCAIWHQKTLIFPLRPPQDTSLTIPPKESCHQASFYTMPHRSGGPGGPFLLFAGSRAVHTISH